MIQRSDFKDVADTAPIAETDRFSKEYWTIGQMAGHFDVSLRTLRFYEDRGLISPLRHGATRFYGAECRRTLDRVLRAKKTWVHAHAYPEAPPQQRRGGNCGIAGSR